ncbi:lysozyme [Qipengyuania aquimaris]|uniref:lysozyme n=1 Tax=Qipengyuania aquimaris TaxID=255984 RepID=UPI001CD5F764|nr:lysozyme [Qipengyuania aquimaris]MCA0902418.1 lysozyme [Qipengyuania aquimaris]
MKQEVEQKDRVAPSSDRLRPAPISGSLQDERIRAIMRELDRPLDSENWTATPHAGEQKRARKFLERIKQHRRHRRDLKRARKTAQQVFNVKPRMSSRKRATLMMGAGAVGLAAFTGPPTQNSRSKPQSAATYVMSAEDQDVRKPAALMKASDNFKQALIEEEGVRYTVYRDVAGYPTVGVGHLITPEDNLRVGDRISEERVLSLLERDLQTAERGVRILVGDLPLYQHEFDALLDLVYNVGLGNVSESKSPRLNAAIEAGDYEQIAAELDYTHAAGKVARGLEFRSERRAQMFLDASYENPRDT